jgi:hypothetical protein
VGVFVFDVQAHKVESTTLFYHSTTIGLLADRNYHRSERCSSRSRKP